MAIEVAPAIATIAPVAGAFGEAVLDDGGGLLRLRRELRERRDRLQLLLLAARLQLVGEHHEAAALEELLRRLNVA